MQFSDVTNKNGLIQDCEFWTNLGDAGISGNSFLLAQFTNRINRRYEKMLGMVDATSRLAQTDDTNYTDQSFSYFNLVSGQNDYQFLTDEDGNSITDFTAVLILPSTTATDFVKLDLLTLDNVNAELIMSPNPSNTGIPAGYIERNNTIFLDVVPNYSKTNGGKLFYKRVPSYFLTSDTTKKPGFNANHHQLLSLAASYDWLLAHQSGNTTLITRTEAMLASAEKEFKVFCELRNPVKVVMSPRIHDSK